MLDCIVIGAGPGGLVTTKELLEQGVRQVMQQFSFWKK